MRAEKVIYTLLGADVGVIALVGAKVYPSRIPQNTVMPAIVYEAISGHEITPMMPKLAISSCAPASRSQRWERTMRM